MTELVLICSDDSAVKFHATAVEERFLDNAVARALFTCAVLGSEERAEVARVIDGLKREGHVSFEDGWIELRTGMADAVSFFMLKMEEARADADYEDRRRYEELQGRVAAENRFNDLRRALVDALSEPAKVLAHASALGKPK